MQEKNNAGNLSNICIDLQKGLFKIDRALNLLILFRDLDVSGQSVDSGVILRAVHGGADVTFMGFLMELHKLGDVELGLLEDLALADVDILDGEDALALLLDLLANGLGDEFLDEVAEGAAGGLVGHDLTHLVANLLHLGGVTVRGGLDLVGLTGGEGDAEHADGVAVVGLDFAHGLDGGLPLLDEGAELVAGHGHGVEVGEAIAALNVLDHQGHLAVALIVIVVQVSEVHLDDAVLETFGGDLGTLGTGDQGLAALALTEVRRGLDVVPFLGEEDVTDLLLVALLASLGEALVFANSHDVMCF